MASPGLQGLIDPPVPSASGAALSARRTDAGSLLSAPLKVVDLDENQAITLGLSLSATLKSDSSGKRFSTQTRMVEFQVGARAPVKPGVPVSPGLFKTCCMDRQHRFFSGEVAYPAQALASLTPILKGMGVTTVDNNFDWSGAIYFLSAMLSYAAVHTVLPSPSALIPPDAVSLVTKPNFPQTGITGVALLTADFVQFVGMDASAWIQAALALTGAKVLVESAGVTENRAQVLVTGNASISALRNALNAIYGMYDAAGDTSTALFAYLKGVHAHLSVIGHTTEGAWMRDVLRFGGFHSSRGVGFRHSSPGVINNKGDSNSTTSAVVVDALVSAACLALADPLVTVDSRPVPSVATNNDDPIVIFPRRPDIYERIRTGASDTTALAADVVFTHQLVSAGASKRRLRVHIESVCAGLEELLGYPPARGDLQCAFRAVHLQGVAPDMPHSLIPIINEVIGLGEDWISVPHAEYSARSIAADVGALFSAGGSDEYARALGVHFGVPTTVRLSRLLFTNVQVFLHTEGLEHRARHLKVAAAGLYFWIEPTGLTDPDYDCAANRSFVGSHALAGFDKTVPAFGMARLDTPRALDAKVLGTTLAGAFSARSVPFFSYLRMHEFDGLANVKVVGWDPASVAGVPTGRARPVGFDEPVSLHELTWVGEDRVLPTPYEFMYGAASMDLALADIDWHRGRAVARTGIPHRADVDDWSRLSVTWSASPLSSAGVEHGVELRRRAGGNWLSATRTELRRLAQRSDAALGRLKNVSTVTAWLEGRNAVRTQLAARQEPRALAVYDVVVTTTDNRADSVIALRAARATVEDTLRAATTVKPSVAAEVPPAMPLMSPTQPLDPTAEHELRPAAGPAETTTSSNATPVRTTVAGAADGVGDGSASGRGAEPLDTGGAADADSGGGGYLDL